jgi:hypothetical protein
MVGIIHPTGHLQLISVGVRPLWVPFFGRLGEAEKPVNPRTSPVVSGLTRIP